MNAEERMKIIAGRYALTPRESAYKEILEHIKQAEQAAFEEGQREMRERSAKAIDHLYEDAMYTSVLTYGATKIRALSVEE